MKKLLPLAFLFLTGEPQPVITPYHHYVIESWEVPDYKKKIAKDFYEAGASFSLIQEMIEHDDIFLLSEGFKRYGVDKKYKDEFTDTPWFHSVKAAQNHPSFHWTFEDITNKIDGLVNSSDRYIEHFDYPDIIHLETATEIKNQHMLSLLFQYVSFFHNNTLDKEGFFPHDKRSYENGGVIANNGKFALELVDTDFMWKYQSPVFKFHNSRSKNYIAPPMLRYINRLGAFHTHPKHNLESHMPGPSTADFRSFDKLSQTNPYAIHAAISLMPDDRYNVDLYFRDLIEQGDSILQDKSITYFLDVGTFSFSSKP